MALVTARDLTKNYGEFCAVNNIGFNVNDGEIFGLLGPNGAGKTTTINMIIGLAKITSGSVSIDGVEYKDIVAQAQEIMGIVPDESNLYDELNGFENLCFCASLYGINRQARQKRASKLLEQFGLESAKKKPFKAYSKGMKRKLTIAAGIIHKPKILFLDEPTTGIDVASARQIRKLLLSLNDGGTTIFLTTHYIEEAERLCHRIAFIVGGKIVRNGTVGALMQEAQKDSVVQFSFENGALKYKDELIKEFPEITVGFIDDTTVRIHSAEHIDLMPFMQFFHQQQLIVYEAKMIKPSLEEVFVKVTGLELEAMKKEQEGSKK